MSALAYLPQEATVFSVGPYCNREDRRYKKNYYSITTRFHSKPDGQTTVERRSTDSQSQRKTSDEPLYPTLPL